MKKNKTISLIAGLMSSLLLMAFIIISCNKKNVDPIDSSKTTIPKDILDFSNSPVFKEFATNFPEQYKYLDLSKGTIVPASNTKMILITIRDNNKELVGTLTGYFLPKGGFQLIYQAFVNFNESTGGTIELYTSKMNFIADFSVKLVNKRSIVQVQNVGSKANVSIVNPKYTSDVAFPKPSDGWWTCTTGCYSQSKAACGSSNSCNFSCDLLGFGTYCTGTIAAACAIYCTGVAS